MDEVIIADIADIADKSGYSQVLYFKLIPWPLSILFYLFPELLAFCYIFKNIFITSEFLSDIA